MLCWLLYITTGSFKKTEFPGSCWSNWRRRLHSTMCHLCCQLAHQELFAPLKIWVLWKERHVVRLNPRIKHGRQNTVIRFLHIGNPWILVKRIKDLIYLPDLTNLGESLHFISSFNFSSWFSKSLIRGITRLKQAVSGLISQVAASKGFSTLHNTESTIFTVLD